MRRIMMTWLLVMAVGMAFGQKKDISAAKDLVKQGKDLAKAEQSMVKLLADSANRTNGKIWSVLFDALQKQYEQGNEKLYLKQKYDTASLFTIASRMFTYMEAYDSVAVAVLKSRDDGKKKTSDEPKMRKDNAAKLNLLRPNLYNGGIYFLRKQDYKQAYQLLDQYVGSADEPMFKGYQYAVRDSRLPEAAYWAVYCGYKLKDAQKVYHHTYLAMKDTTHNEPMLQYLASAYLLDGDTARYVQTLAEGFEKYPRSDFFFPHLINYYSAVKDWEKALAATDYALKADSASATALLTKSTILLNTGDYAGCFDISSKLVSRDSTLAEAWLNAGLALFNEGVGLDKNVQTLKKKRDEILACYRQALPYLEGYRRLCPEASGKWALPLYTIYLNLNMGKKFDEIDKILKK